MNLNERTNALINATWQIENKSTGQRADIPACVLVLRTGAEKTPIIGAGFATGEHDLAVTRSEAVVSFTKALFRSAGVTHDEVKGSGMTDTTARAALRDCFSTVVPIDAQSEANFRAAAADLGNAPVAPVVAPQVAPVAPTAPVAPVVAPQVAPVAAPAAPAPAAVAPAAPVAQAATTDTTSMAYVSACMLADPESPTHDETVTRWPLAVSTANPTGFKESSQLRGGKGQKGANGIVAGANNFALSVKSSGFKNPKGKTGTLEAFNASVRADGALLNRIVEGGHVTFDGTTPPTPIVTGRTDPVVASAAIVALIAEHAKAAGFEAYTRKAAKTTGPQAAAITADDLAAYKSL